MNNAIIPSELATRLRDRTRAMVGELIPDEALTDFIAQEVKAMFTDKSVQFVDGKAVNTESYHKREYTVVAGSVEMLTPIQSIIRSEMHADLRARVLSHLAAAAPWDDKTPTQLAAAVTAELAPLLVQNMFQGLVQQSVNAIRQQMR